MTLRRSARSFVMLTVVLSGALVLTACGTSDQDEEGTAQALPAHAPLVPADAEAFEAYMKTALMDLGDPWARVMLDDGSLVASGAQPPAPGPEDASDRSGAFSTTNLQTTGVDEADTVKFDGRSLFVARPALFGYMLPRPVAPPPAPDPSTGIAAGFVADASFFYPEYETLEPARVAIYRAENDPASAEERAVIELDAAVEVYGLVLLPAEGAAPPLLAVVATTGAGFSYALDFRDPWAFGGGEVHLFVYDVSDPDAPEPVANLRLEGIPNAVRRIGDRLTVVTSFSPYLRELAAAPFDIESRRSMVENATLENLLPRVWTGDHDLDGTPLVTPDDCFVPESTSDTQGSYYYRPTLVSITSIDLRDLEDRISVCAAGPVDRVYSSTRALYLASTVYGQRNETVVHKFRYDSDGPRFRGSGSASGLPAGSQRNFGLGEHGANFGIVTSSSQWTDDGLEVNNHFTLMRESEKELALETVAELPNESRPDPIGKPGESLFAVRFVADRVYAVTFRRIDPLYVIDFSEPTDPFIAGEVVVEGFSDYLQPLGANLLLGVGLATASDGPNDWLQGVKIELFDVSDPTTPVRIDSQVIGRRGSDTSARYQHQAVNILDMGDGHHRVTVPIRVHEDGPVYGDPGAPDAYYDWTYTGLHLFEVEESGPTLSARGVVVAAAADDSEVGDIGTESDRARLQGDAVHYVHDNRVWSASWNAPQDAVGPQ